MSPPTSLAWGVWILALSGLDCGWSANARPTRGGGESSPGTGPESRSPTTCVMNLRGREGGAMPETDSLASLRAASGGSSRSYVISSAEESPARTGPSPGSEPESVAAGPAFSSTGPTESQGSLFDQDGSCSRTSRDSYRLPTEGTLESFSQRWANSGMAWPGAYSMLGTSESPRGAVASSLSDILEASPDRRYALSARAAAGILRRADARGRDLPPELEAALRAMAQSAPSRPTARDADTGSTRSPQQADT